LVHIPFAPPFLADRRPRLCYGDSVRRPSILHKRVSWQICWTDHRDFWAYQIVHNPITTGYPWL